MACTGVLRFGMLSVRMQLHRERRRQKSKSFQANPSTGCEHAQADASAGEGKVRPHTWLAKWQPSQERGRTARRVARLREVVAAGLRYRAARCVVAINSQHSTLTGKSTFALYAILHDARCATKTCPPQNLAREVRTSERLLKNVYFVAFFDGSLRLARFTNSSNHSVWLRNSLTTRQSFSFACFYCESHFVIYKYIVYKCTKMLQAYVQE